MSILLLSQWIPSLSATTDSRKCYLDCMIKLTGSIKQYYAAGSLTCVMARPFSLGARAQQAYDLRSVGVLEMIQRKKANEKFPVRSTGQHRQWGGFWYLSKCSNSSGNKGWHLHNSVFETKCMVQKTEVHIKQGSSNYIYFSRNKAGPFGFLWQFGTWYFTETGPQSLIQAHSKLEHHVLC